MDEFGKCSIGLPQFPIISRIRFTVLKTIALSFYKNVWGGGEERERESKLQFFLFSLTKNIRT